MSFFITSDQFFLDVIKSTPIWNALNNNYTLYAVEDDPAVKDILEPKSLPFSLYGSY